MYKICNTNQYLNLSFCLILVFATFRFFQHLVSLRPFKTHLALIKQFIIVNVIIKQNKKITIKKKLTDLKFFNCKISLKCLDVKKK